MNRIGGHWALAVLWLVVLAVALGVRPLLPVDETRYVSVAWEMWQRDDFLVPYLNGEPYSHKPPLLFWLIHAGWALFGVNEWWPRLVAPLVSLVDLALAVQLARLLWPQDRLAAQLVPWLLFGTFVWTVFFTLVQFDLLLVAAVLLGMIGLVGSWQGRPWGWPVFALAIGVGALIKGPVILLHLLPVALLTPWWARQHRPVSWWRWYAGLLTALMVGASLGLAWAWPAAQAGGEAYREAIFWGQHAGRMDARADHAQPWWWYVVILPLMLLPWVLWPHLWRALRQLSRDDTWRLCLAWVLPVLLLFSLVGGKQGKYLLPLFPALALLAARGLSQWRGADRERLWGAGLFALAAGLLLLAGPWLPMQVHWLARLETSWGGLLVLAAVLLWRRPVEGVTGAVLTTALVSVLMAILLHLSVLRAMAPAYDLADLSQKVARIQRQGGVVAVNDPYHGELQFLGRLRKPLGPQLRCPEFEPWVAAQEQPYMLFYQKRPQPWRPGVIHTQPYRTGTLTLWDAAALLRHLDLASASCNAGLYPL